MTSKEDAIKQEVCESEPGLAFSGRLESPDLENQQMLAIIDVKVSVNPRLSPWGGGHICETEFLDGG